MESVLNKQPAAKAKHESRTANFTCRCGRPMVWVKGHAVCAGCEGFLPACKCE